MKAFFEFARTHPWSALAAALMLAVLVLSQFIGYGGDGAAFPDIGGD